MQKSVLAGRRVIELGTMLAAPFAAQNASSPLDSTPWRAPIAHQPADR